MAQQLGALAAVAEALGLFPAPAWYLTTVSNSSSRGSDILFYLSLSNPHVHTSREAAHIHRYKNK